MNTILKAVLVGVFFGLVLFFGMTGEANASTLEGESNPFVFSSLPDEQRWLLSNGGMYLPVAPVGYVWAEDLTLVPVTFYAKPSGV